MSTNRTTLISTLISTLFLLIATSQNLLASLPESLSQATQADSARDTGLPVISRTRAVFLPCLTGTEASCGCRNQLTSSPRPAGGSAKTVPCGKVFRSKPRDDDGFFAPLSGDGNTNRTRLDASVLAGNSLDRMDYRHYALPANAAEPENRFEGRLILNQGNKTRMNFIEIDTQYADNFTDEDHLPAFDFSFVQFGSHLIPRKRGLIRTPDSNTWEWLLEPGRVWDENADNGYSRASLPFALQQRGANCTHNGVLTFLFKDDGSISNVAVQIGAETCLYFNYDMWGMVTAQYQPQTLADANSLIGEYQAEVERRMPVKPIAELDIDYAEFGVDHTRIGREQGEDMASYGVAIDGIHYSGRCRTRYGDYPYCEVMDLPSYSTSKTFFASYALALLTQQQGDHVADLVVADYVPECDGGQWDDVTFENLIDMTTGNYDQSGYDSDESSATTSAEFFQVFSHTEKIQHSCAYTRKSPPGNRMVYHSSDTYILGSALNDFIGNEDIFDKLVAEIYKPLGLSQTSYAAVRTYDQRAQMLASHGMTLHKDDFIKLAEFLTKSLGKINDKQIIDRDMVDTMLLKTNDIGLPTFNTFNRYLNGVWTYDLGSNNNFNCPAGSWVSYMSGFGGIGVVLLPNDMVYYFISDSGRFPFYEAALELHKIRSLCP